jgi:hypothetical protein
MEDWKDGRIEAWKEVMMEGGKVEGSEAGMDRWGIRSDVSSVALWKFSPADCI